MLMFMLFFAWCLPSGYQSNVTAGWGSILYFEYKKYILQIYMDKA